MTLTNVTIECCTATVLNEEPALPSRGSLRARGAAAISNLTLRQISAALPHFISQSLRDSDLDQIAG